MEEYVNCKVCNDDGKLSSSNDVRKVFSNVRCFQKEAFTIWRCHSCHSLHSQEPVNLNYYYQHYPLQQHTLDLWARVAYRNRLKRFLSEGLNPSHTQLDYGCGKGLYVNYLLEKGYLNSFGYDAFVEDFKNMELLNRTYDAVNAQDVIEHAEDPTFMMSKLSDLVTVGGLLCIGTPDAGRINLAEADKFALSLHQPYHRHILSEDALIDLGTQFGLEPSRIYHRWYYDTLFPTVNHRFLQTYIAQAGNALDVAFEEPKIGMVLTSPKLLFYALFGYFFPPLTEMTIFFRKK